MQIIFHHGFRLDKDGGDFSDLETIDFFEQKGKVLFEGKRFGHACKTKRDVFLDFELALRRGLPNLHRFSKKLLVMQHFFPANVGHRFGPSFL